MQHATETRGSVGTCSGYRHWQAREGSGGDKEFSLEDLSTNKGSPVLPMEHLLANPTWPALLEGPS